MVASSQVILLTLAAAATTGVVGLPAGARSLSVRSFISGAAQMDAMDTAMKLAEKDAAKGRVPPPPTNKVSPAKALRDRKKAEKAAKAGAKRELIVEDLEIRDEDDLLFAREYYFDELYNLD